MCLLAVAIVKLRISRIYQFGIRPETFDERRAGGRLLCGRSGHRNNGDKGAI